MHHNNSPLPSHLNAYADFADRFWYWRGVSGRQYIHSVYKPRQCPPLPGGVYIAVKRSGDHRLALAIGLFSDFWNDGVGLSLRSLPSSADEIHVHLLARSPEGACAVAADLRAAMDDAPAGLAEDAPSLALPSIAEARAA
jgi:hypothetical protein